MSSDIYPTLKSLGGLRVGFHHTESTLNDATSCLGLNNTVNFCQNAVDSDVRFESETLLKTFQVYTVTTSVLLRGIPNITLVPLYDKTFGVWQPERNAFNGVFGHLGRDIDAVLATWGEKVA